MKKLLMLAGLLTGTNVYAAELGCFSESDDLIIARYEDATVSKVMYFPPDANRGFLYVDIGNPTPNSFFYTNDEAETMKMITFVSNLSEAHHLTFDRTTTELLEGTNIHFSCFDLADLPAEPTPTKEIVLEFLKLRYVEFYGTPW